ncbi:hypothetical protein [Streptomyces sp. Ac-502]|uniref:hypothetical protein n=1 Tax=Streptomyces sp. Ac-502 TaxID=3342801 RepID=UPI003862C513
MNLPPLGPAGADETGSAARSGRARDRFRAEPLDLPREGVARPVRGLQLAVQCDDLYGEPGHAAEEQQGGDHGKPFGARQPSGGLVLDAHFAITAHTAIAAAIRPISTGTII